MPKVVKTPQGQEQTVLTEDELISIVEAYATRDFRLSPTGDVLCPDCSTKMSYTSIEYVGLRETDNGSIPSWNQAKQLQEEEFDNSELDEEDVMNVADIIRVQVGFCTVCEEPPDVIGLPVAWYPSYHNRPH